MSKTFLKVGGELLSFKMPIVTSVTAFIEEAPVTWEAEVGFTHSRFLVECFCWFIFYTLIIHTGSVFVKGSVAFYMALS